MFWCSGIIWGHFWQSSKLVDLIISSRFRVLYSTLFWCPGIISSAFLAVIKTHRFGYFWLFSWTIANCFGCPGSISWTFLAVIKTRRFGHLWSFPCAIANCFVIRGWFRRHFGSHQNSLIWSFRTVFVCCSILFWCPGLISWAFLAVIETHRFGQFSLFSCDIANCFGIRGRFWGAVLAIIKSSRFGHFW